MAVNNLQNDSDRLRIQKKMKLSLILIISIWLLVPNNVWCETYYIDPSLKQNGDGSLSNPYNNWYSVTWAAGNTYLQKRGTESKLTITVEASGTQDAWITLGAYGTGSKPKVKTTGPEQLGDINATSGCNGIVLSGCSYVKVENFELSTTGDAECVYGFRGHHIILENLDVGPAGGHGVWLLFHDNVIVRKCIFHHSGGLKEWKSADNIHLENCHDYLVEKCISYNALQGAVYDASDGGRGYTTGCWQYNIGYRTPDSDTEHKNWSIFKMSGHHEKSTVTLLYNIAYGSFNGPAYALQEELQSIAIGNLAYNCQAGFQQVPAGNILKNNIVVNCDEVIYFPRGNFPDEMDYNLYWNNKSFSSMGEFKFKSLNEFQDIMNLDRNSIEQDPLFTNAANHDFTLKEDSPAIDAADSLNPKYMWAINPVSLWSSNVRVVNQNHHGIKWDIGPFVYMKSQK
jgi:hypothetical protein